MEKKNQLYVSGGDAFKKDLMDRLHGKDVHDLLNNGIVVVEDISLSSTDYFGNIKLCDSLKEVGEYIHEKTGYEVLFEPAIHNGMWEIFVMVPAKSDNCEKVLYGVCAGLRKYLELIMDDATRYLFSSRTVDIVRGQISRDVLDKVSIMYRTHRGSLKEAMVELKEFCSIEDMKRHIIEEWKPYGESYTMDDIVIGSIKGDDERIGWKSCRYVCVKHMQGRQFDVPQCVGMCAIHLVDGFLPDKISDAIVAESNMRREQ